MNRIKQIKPIHILFIFVILNLVLGVFIAPDFGRSTDESHEFRTAQVALSIYTGEIKENPSEKYEALRHDRFYGTASTATIGFIERLVFPNTDHSAKVVAHYVYFIFFQAAVIGIFLLARHFFDDWVSLSVALIFGTQPLLFGHAFINPKDIPILTTFLFTMVTGFSMVDSWLQDDPGEVKQASPRSTQRGKKRLVLILFFSLFFILWCSPWISNLILDLIEYGYNTKGSGFIGNIFASITTHGSLEGYLNLGSAAILQVYRWIAFGTPLLLLFGFLFAQRNQLFGKKINVLMLLAAAVWGFAISTRVLAITAGGMIGLYALIRFRAKAVFPLIVYTLTASMISYITWPLIWIVGFRGYFESLSLFNNFPWTGQVLFEGESYLPTELPARFIPKLMMLQFTEPLVVLVVVGLAVSLYMLFKRKTDILKLSLILAWFFLPLFYTMIGHPTIYSNFRHFLFIIPPLFIFAGFSLQLIASRLKRSVLILGICLLLIVPGLITIGQVHPFEYFYYNSFVGGIEGAHNQYDLDYWGISYKNAMDYVNENVPPGSRILVWKDNLSGKAYAEQEYEFAAHTTVPEREYQEFDYMIIPTIQYSRHAYFGKLPVVYSVEIDNVNLMVVLEILHDEH